ncbi:hypothetical protein C8Q72DRAFT_811085 [Fomitopsis betulina]|nr:hypothetical protein C8Q72DRAFT_811085 [Fomitopsis betulina]
MLSSLPLSLLLVVSSTLSFVAAQSSTSRSASSAATNASGVTATSSGTGSRSGSATSTASLPSFSGYSTCVDDCIDSAVAFTGCPSVAAVDCYCSISNSTNFAQSLTTCLAANCPNSIAPAESLANQLCAVASQSTSISFATTSISASSSSSVTSSISSSNTTSHSTTSHTTSASPSATSTGAGVRQGADVVCMVAGLVMAAYGVLGGL